MARVLATLFAAALAATTLPPTPPAAAAAPCRTSGPFSGAYTVTICITAPAHRETVGGETRVSASITTTGNAPGIRRLTFYLDGEYLLADLEEPWTFLVPTVRWEDGPRVLSASASMQGGFTSARASIRLLFDNTLTRPWTGPKPFEPRTGTTPPEGEPLVTAVVGDGADGGSAAAKVVDLIESWSPNLVLYVGDVYLRGTMTEFHNWWGSRRRRWERFRTITNPTPGNHEYYTLGAAGYFDHWGDPPGSYSVDTGGWHIISLNTNCTEVGGCDAGSREYEWLRQDLAAGRADCTAASFHHPVFDVNPLPEDPDLTDMWTLMSRRGVDMIFTGHDHNYQRWYPLSRAGKIDPGGTTQMIVGTGGRAGERIGGTDPRIAVAMEPDDYGFGALRLSLYPNGAIFQFINTRGKTLDTGAVNCSGNIGEDVTPPTAPTGLIAEAAGPNTVNLSWTASLDDTGVTGYRITRDGALLETVGPGTAYTDAGVVSNRTYKYRVRALDEAGNVSPVSNVAKVTTPPLFADGFESGDTSAWDNSSGFTVDADGPPFEGSWAARATSDGAGAFAVKQLPAPQAELFTRLSFRVNAGGTDELTLLQLRSTGGNKRIVGVAVDGGGTMAVRNSVTRETVVSAVPVAEGIWHELVLRALVDGNTGEIEVWLDGTRLDELSGPASLGRADIERLQLGSMATGEPFEILYDAVAADPAPLP